MIYMDLSVGNMPEAGLLCPLWPRYVIPVGILISGHQCSLWSLIIPVDGTALSSTQNSAAPYTISWRYRNTQESGYAHLQELIRLLFFCLLRGAWFTFGLKSTFCIICTAREANIDRSRVVAHQEAIPPIKRWSKDYVKARSTAIKSVHFQSTFLHVTKFDLRDISTPSSTIVFDICMESS